MNQLLIISPYFYFLAEPIERMKQKLENKHMRKLDNKELSGQIEYKINAHEDYLVKLKFEIILISLQSS